MLWGRRRQEQTWSCAGGHLEPNEDPREGAARELFEEAGIDIDPADLEQLGEPRQSGRHLVHCYRLDLKTPVQVTTENDPDKEFDELRWVVLEDGELPAEIADNLHVPAGRNALLQALGMVEPTLCKAEPPDDAYLGDAAGRLEPAPDGSGYRVAWSDALGPLGCSQTLSKAEAARAAGEWLAKDIGGIAAGQRLPTDYNHVLTPEHRQAGYSMVVHHEAASKYPAAAERDEFRKAESTFRDVLVCIPRNRQKAVEEEERQVAAQVAAGLKPPTYFWTLGRLPKQLPRRVYFLWEGAVRAYHDCVGSVTEPDHRLLLDHKIRQIEPVPMKAFRGWRYWSPSDVLKKSEVSSFSSHSEPLQQTDEIARLMTHPDPSERSMALKLAGVGRHHLAYALQSGDPVLEAAALAHPGLDEELVRQVVAMPGRWELKRKLLAREDLPGWALVELTRAALCS